MAYQIAFWITAALLVAAYVALEIAHALTRRTGTVVRIQDTDLPMLPGLGYAMDVELDGGRRVRAHASGCVLCQHPIAPGQRVFLVRQRSGWLISGGRCGK